MAQLQKILVPLLLVSMILVDFGVQSRHCWPACKSDEKCLYTGKQRGLKPFVCVPKRCLFTPRRGRCRNYRHPYHFHRGTMSCRRDRTRACYGRRNRFTTMEDCALTCLPHYRG